MTMSIEQVKDRIEKSVERINKIRDDYELIYSEYLKIEKEIRFMFTLKEMKYKECTENQSLNYAELRKLKIQLRNDTIRLFRLGGKGHTKYDWERIKEEVGHICVKCGDLKKLTKDHIISIYNGGGDNIENIQPLCMSCNREKWYKDSTNYLQETRRQKEIRIEENKQEGLGIH